MICWLSAGVRVEKHHLVLDYLILKRRATVTAEVVRIDRKPEVRSDPLVHILIARGLASKVDWESVRQKGERRGRGGSEQGREEGEGNSNGRSK